jgi:hypothetical protein
MGKDYNPKKGKFIPTRPEKYIGNPNNVIYRSGWELRLMKFLDTQSSVKKWCSEEVGIPYWHPIEQRLARYFIDFFVIYEDEKGNTHKVMIEIKPAAQCRPPESTRGKSKVKLLNEQATYAVNEAKWTAAKQFCKEKGFEFRIMDEYSLGLKKR